MRAETLLTPLGGHEVSLTPPCCCATWLPREQEWQQATVEAQCRDNVVKKEEDQPL